MRVKYRTKDFVVREEIKDLPAGQYYLYLVQKEGITTWEILRRLTRHFRIKTRSLSFCGLKDRNAIAYQHMSSSQSLGQQFQAKKFNLHLIGRIALPLGAQDLLMNHFKIMVRDIKPANIGDLASNIEEIKKYGYTNYFDEQRFESRLGVDDFVARRLMLRHYEGALKLLIGHPLKLDSQELKQFKRLVQECWGEWGKLRRLAPEKFQSIFSQLEKEPKAIERVFKLFDHNYVEFLIAAFQSFLWNETAERFTRQIASAGYDFPYFLGRFYFYHKIEDRYKNYQLPVINHQTAIEDSAIRQIYNEVLKDSGLNQRQLKIKWPDKIRVKSFPRSFIINPAFKSIEVLRDEYFRNRNCLLLEFALPPGSYATLLIKRLIGPKKT